MLDILDILVSIAQGIYSWRFSVGVILTTGVILVIVFSIDGQSLRTVLIASTITLGFAGSLYWQWRTDKSKETKETMDNKVSKD